MVPRAVVTLTVTGFVSAIVYMVLLEQTEVGPEQAARNTLLPIIIVQAVLMMLLATGALVQVWRRNVRMGFLITSV